MDNPTTITATWDDLQESLTLTAKSEGFVAAHIYAGYAPNYYLFEANNKLTLTDIPHSDHEFIYVRAVGLSSDKVEHPESELFIVVPVKHPILGIVKSCDGEDKYIIDFVEKKDGKVTKRWQSGRRVVKISTFDVEFWDGDELYLSEKVCAKQPMERPEDPESGEEGCKFMLWKYETPDPEIDDRAIITFSPNSENIKDYPFQRVKIGEKLVEPPDPVNPNGCPFDGWYYIA